MSNSLTQSELEEAIAIIQVKYSETIPIYQNAQLLIANGVKNEQIIINTTVTETLAWCLSQFESKRKVDETKG